MAKESNQNQKSSLPIILLSFIFLCCNSNNNPVAASDLDPVYEIAFSSSRSGNPEIYLMSEDGINLNQITDYSDRDGYPAWSPGNTQIAFYAYHTTQTWSIHLMSSDGSNRIRLTNTERVWDNGPCWTPDGQDIVFASLRNGESEVRIMNADGSNQKKLGSMSGAAPDVSPDGTKIIFYSNESGNDEIYTMDRDGNNPQKLTDNNHEDWWPEWSPDGSKIAFMSKRDGNFEIYVMDADGSNQVRLTNNDAEDWGPDWSPDGESIVFTSKRDGNYEIYKMDTDGSNQINLTNNSAADIQPCWKNIT